jgi:hypothetical protein
MIAKRKYNIKSEQEIHLSTASTAAFEALVLMFLASAQAIGYDSAGGAPQSSGGWTKT